MILPDCEILAWAKEGGIRPFDPTLVNPASIDLRLGGEFIDLKAKKKFIAAEITVMPGAAYLAATIEYIKLPPSIAGHLYLKSSLARQGLDHALAGWVDPGFNGQLTIEIYSHSNLVIGKIAYYFFCSNTPGIGLRDAEARQPNNSNMVKKTDRICCICCGNALYPSLGHAPRKPWTCGPNAPVGLEIERELAAVCPLF